MQKADLVGKSLAPKYRDAYFQLVLHPIKSVANLHEMYQAVALNWYHAKKNDPLANIDAAKALEYFKKDSLISIEYNKGVANGKWNHIMDQVHIGYTSWNDPAHNIMPLLKHVSEEVISESPSAKEDKSKNTVGPSYIMDGLGIIASFLSLIIART